MSGKMDDIRIYNRTLSASEVQNLYALNSTVAVPNASPVLLGAQFSGTNIFLNYPTTTGQSYQLEYEDDLTPPNWTPMGSPIAGTGNLIIITNNFTGVRRFFRLQISP